MDGGRFEGSTGESEEGESSSGGWHGDGGSVQKEEEGRQTLPCRRIASRSMSGWRGFWVLSCIIVILELGKQGVGLANAGITLPVTRKFSALKGSGAAEGELGGMTKEHAQKLREHDSRRHRRNYRRKLTSTTIADFPLAGNDYEIGLYYTQIGLGSPSSTYYVQVDTGSDLLWVNCKPCPECPTSSDLEIPLRLYNPEASSTSSNTSCSSDLCTDSSIISDNPCVDNSCYYSFSYGDQSTAMGYLVQDKITYDTGVYANGTMAQTSASVVFGCGFNQTGDSLTTSSRATDGIMGFGQASLSVVTQLVDKGLTTNEFAHCLQGDTGQGGIFVIGDIQEPGIVYTGIVEDQYHYNVVLESISMGGVKLDIPPSAFDTNPKSGDSGTIFDSGTTLAILVDEAFDPFKNQLVATATVSPIYARGQEDTPCFQYSGSDLSSVFPSVTLNFEGAAMNLVPSHYLYQTEVNGYNDYLWCLGWQRSSDSNLDDLTILGDIVLKNKLVVYDLANSQIGWVDYDCLSGVSVSNGTAREVLSPQTSDFNNSSGSHSLRGYLPIALLILSSVVLMFATALM